MPLPGGGERYGLTARPKMAGAADGGRPMWPTVATRGQRWPQPGRLVLVPVPGQVGGEQHLGRALGPLLEGRVPLPVPVVVPDQLVQPPAVPGRLRPLVQEPADPLPRLAPGVLPLLPLQVLQPGRPRLPVCRQEGPTVRLPGGRSATQQATEGRAAGPEQGPDGAGRGEQGHWQGSGARQVGPLQGRRCPNVFPPLTAGAVGVRMNVNLSTLSRGQPDRRRFFAIGRSGA